jgi:hypothetical protein
VRAKELVGKDVERQLLQTFLVLTKEDIVLLTESDIKTATIAGQVIKMVPSMAANLRGQLKCLLTKE